MEPNRKTGIIIGLLFIIGTVSGMTSVFFTGGIANSHEYLIQIASDDKRFILGSLLVLLMGFSLAFIPIILYPVLRKYSETLATGYVVFRGALETATYITIWLSMLLLLYVSKNHATPDADPQQFEKMVAVLLEFRELSSISIVFVFGTGALLFYTVLYRSKLIPVWLSVWGLFAIVLHLITGVLILFEVQTETSPSYMIMNFPIFLQEMVMAVWLIVKGFDPGSFNRNITDT